MYKNAQYIEDKNGVQYCIQVQIGDVISLVPINPANTDYANIMALVEAGELTIAPAEGGN